MFNLLINTLRRKLKLSFVSAEHPAQSTAGNRRASFFKASFRMCSLCHSICDQCHRYPSSPVFHLRMLCSAPQQRTCFSYTRTHVSPSARRAHSGCDFLELEVYTLFGWQVPWLWLLGDIIGIMVSALHACRCFPGRCGHTSTWLIRFSTDVHGSSDSARSSFLINSFSTL